MNHLFRLLRTSAWLSCCLLMVLLTGCRATRSAGIAPPEGLIWYWDTPSGLTYHFQSAPGGPDSVTFAGRVYVAAKDTSGSPMDTMRHPLVILAHGKVLSGVPNNYKAMTYLTEHLASWGDVVMSVNLDVVTFLQGTQTQNGVPHRSELILHAVEYMIAQSRDPQSPFYNRIDTNRIALVGHSRGGGAVIGAANANWLGRKRPIKAIATISPANFGTQPLFAPVPHICLYGSWDGDMCRGEGPAIWARGTRSAPRELVEIYGANHYYFTDNAQFWGDSTNLSRKDHHTIAKGMINAWMGAYLRQKSPYDWMDYLIGTERLAPNLEYYTSFQSSQCLPVYANLPVLSSTANPEVSTQDSIAGVNTKLLPPTMPSSGCGCEFLPKGLSEFSLIKMEAAPDYCVGTAVMASWDERKDHLSLQMQPTNVADYGYLVFRASQIHGDSLNKVDCKKDFCIRVCDQGGQCSEVFARAYQGGLQYPDLSASLLPDDPDNRKQIMRGFRIPLADFKGADLRAINKIEFDFDRPYRRSFDNRSGSIKVADVEFSK